MFNAEFLGTPITTSRSIHNPPPVRRECCPAAKLQILEQALTAELGSTEDQLGPHRGGTKPDWIYLSSIARMGS
ncbi:hypothetical protein GE21DRAFT_1290519 [Neurospora crassa]|nr:hypothetical protein GE21DRAFT_1290519 [Neurospora crassa]